MVSIRIPRAEAWIPHPQQPDLRVLLEEPTRAELGKRQYDMAKRRGAPVAVLHPTSGEPIRNAATGKIETELPAFNADPEEVKTFLAQTVCQVEGIEEKDAKIPEIIAAFEERPFDVVLEDGKRQPFIVYLFLKLFEDSTFERADPLAKTSASPQNSN